MSCGVERTPAVPGVAMITGPNRPKSPPMVSVLMLTMSRTQFVERAVESIRNQTYQDWELLIVQDGNHQPMTELLTSLAAREPRIRYWRRAEKGNIADANNFGLKRALGRYIAILDDDDFWIDKGKLERQVEFLENNPDYVACGGGAICIDQRGEETFRYLKPQADTDIKRHALKANPFIHSTLLYRTKVAEKLGFYDTSLAGFQDWDLVLKLGHQGKVYNFPEYFLCYQMWDGSGSFGAQRQNTKSALRIVNRHRSQYGGYGVAIAMASLYYAYARVPRWVKSITFGPLSRMKKAVFSAKPVALSGQRSPDPISARSRTNVVPERLLQQGD